MSGRASRDKGRRFEQEVAIRFRDVYPRARRLLENHAEDAQGVDLLHTGPFKVQCKALGNYAPLARIQEVQCDRALGDIPVLVTKGDNLEPLAALPLSDFLRLVEAYVLLVDKTDAARPGA